jgi:UDP-glucose 4-epimerase
MKILITGIAGFIGSHLAEALLAEGHEVSGIDDLSTGRLDNVPADAAFVEGDIAFEDDWPKRRKWDVIYHCAASYKDRGAWEADAFTNVMGTLNVIRAAQQNNARIVYFQTSLCYGPNPFSPVREQDPLDPHGSYAVSKTAGEAYIRDSGLDYVSLRLANMYGPRNLSGPVPTFYQRISEGKPCTVVDSRRDFVYVGDLIRVATKALAQGSGAYNVASGQDVSINALHHAIATVMQVGGIQEVEVVPRQPDDVATLLLDPARMIGEFGVVADTLLSEGLNQTVAWYRDHPVTETYTHLAMKG